MSVAEDSSNLWRQSLWSLHCIQADCTTSVVQENLVAEWHHYFDVVIIVPSALYQQPQLDEGGDNIPQLTQPLTWISLTASTNPPTSTLNLPNWSSFAPKHTGAVFSLRHGASIFENKSKYENATYHCKKTSKEEHNMIWNRFVEQNWWLRFIYLFWFFCILLIFMWIGLNKKEDKKCYRNLHHISITVNYITKIYKYIYVIKPEE